ncbi:hypothetical protein V8G54_032397 [Vigna mungo]|uniref:Uncharacterized protein n=1 Tax=Vigna mungo TaxID=3915 RepID=A0AAQ3ML19_VIGMU
MKLTSESLAMSRSYVTNFLRVYFCYVFCCFTFCCFLLFHLLNWKSLIWAPCYTLLPTKIMYVTHIITRNHTKKFFKIVKILFNISKPQLRNYFTVKYQKYYLNSFIILKTKSISNLHEFLMNKSNILI